MNKFDIEENVHGDLTTFQRVSKVDFRRSGKPSINISVLSSSLCRILSSLIEKDSRDNS